MRSAADMTQPTKRRAVCQMAQETSHAAASCTKAVKPVQVQLPDSRRMVASVAAQGV